MKIIEFRSRARDIAAERSERSGSGPRTTCCHLNVWDHVNLSTPGVDTVVDWDIWDAEQGEHYSADTAEGALALYRIGEDGPDVEAALEDAGDPDPEPAVIGDAMLGADGGGGGC